MNYNIIMDVVLMIYLKKCKIKMMNYILMNKFITKCYKKMNYITNLIIYN